MNDDHQWMIMVGTVGIMEVVVEVEDMNNAVVIMTGMRELLLGTPTTVTEGQQPDLHPSTTTEPGKLPDPPVDRLADYSNGLDNNYYDRFYKKPTPPITQKSNGQGFLQSEPLYF